jgi:uncharacterized membrane protein/mono/diheme cytochrome c family protein
MSDQTAPNLLLFFGHFHPLLVHLPIGFLAILAVLELANRVHHFKHAAEARGVVLGLTAISAILTVACGLMLATEGGYDAHLLAWHKWMGIGLATSCVLTAICFWTKLRRLYLGLLMITLLLLGPASHFGGSITHGEGYLTEYAPNWIRSIFNSAPEKPAEKEVATTENAPVDPEDEPIYPAVIRPVLAQNCVSCHNAEKLKGQLRLDSIEAMKQGGKSGPAMVAGNVAASGIVQRIELPLSDQKHMPPPGKAPLSDDNITILKWWIEAGAPTDKSMADLDPPVKVADVLRAKLGLPPPAPVDPLPLAQLQSKIDKLSSELGIVIEPQAVDQPWLAVNASVSRKFGDNELAELAALSRNIAALNLAGTKVTDNGIAILATMPNLSHVRLERTAITDAGLKNLSKLRKLDYLNLYGTAVSDAGLQSLRGLPSLHHLYLWRTKVPPEAATRFAEAMTDHAKITRLREQIDALQNQIAGANVEVVAGTPTTAPATKPATAPATKSTSKPTTRAATTRGA